MTQADAIAGAFVLRHTGVTAVPVSARLVEGRGARDWAVVCPAAAFFPHAAARGAAIDGPDALRVYAAAGDVSVLG